MIALLISAVWLVHVGFLLGLLWVSNRHPRGR